jgi:hypothetical protein
MIKDFDNWITSSGSESGHVKDAPDRRPAAFDKTFAPHFATIVAEWGDTD